MIKHITQVSAFVHADDDTKNFLSFIIVPEHGVFVDKREVAFQRDEKEVISNIWHIGGGRGWYFGDWTWGMRGLMDTFVGGVGLRRGRRSPSDLKSGDAPDFWRVLVADKSQGRLLLCAEMKLPGEAWLEFRVKTTEGKSVLYQTATFRPLGVGAGCTGIRCFRFTDLFFGKWLKILSPPKDNTAITYHP